MPNSFATAYAKKSAKGHSPENDTLILNPVVFKISMYKAGSIYSYNTTNPARAYTLCKPACEGAYPVCITVWLKVGNDYMMPLTYNACSMRDLDKAFKSITFDMTNAERLLNPDESPLNWKKENTYENEQSNQLEETPTGTESLATNN